MVRIGPAVQPFIVGHHCLFAAEFHHIAIVGIDVGKDLTVAQTFLKFNLEIIPRKMIHSFAQRLDIGGNFSGRSAQLKVLQVNGFPILPEPVGLQIFDEFELGFQFEAFLD